jgi:hypothetical protein
VLAHVKQMCQGHGGPQQLLQAILKGPEDQPAAEWGRKLVAMFPPCDGVEYAWHEGLPAGTVSDFGDVMTCHVSNLGWGECTSTKAFPLMATCEKLAAEILRDGFMTNSEPLICTQPPQLCRGNDANYVSDRWLREASRQVALSMLSLGYVKGCARATTCHALQVLLDRDEVDVQTVFPALYESPKHHVLQCPAWQFGQ